MLFHPMVAEVSGSSISPLHVTNPVRLHFSGADGRVPEARNRIGGRSGSSETKELESPTPTMCKSCETSFSGSAIQLPRRKFLALLGAALSTPLSLRAAAKGPLPKPQNVITADEALNRQ
jgi:hypothetical protein